MSGSTATAALVLEPKLIMCDEPVAALDVSIRTQILNLLLDIQAADRVSYIFITHDLSTVRMMAHNVAVMRSGRIVEQGAADEAWANPQDDYTRELLNAVPPLEAALQRTAVIGGKDGIQAPRSPAWSTCFLDSFIRSSGPSGVGERR